MNTVVHCGSRKGCVTVPASKSWAHRMLITAALSENESEIICDGISKDISATASCLNALGARIELNDNGGTTVIKVKPVSMCSAERKTALSSFVGASSSAGEATDIRPAAEIGTGTSSAIGEATGTVPGVKNHTEAYRDLYCGESGSTLRFLIPVVGALGLIAVFHMEGRLSERPLEPLVSVLREHGMRIEQEGKLLYCSGQLKSGYYRIPGNISSQYISGLLMALPVISGESVIEITGTIESGDYISMTVEAVKAAGIELTLMGNKYFIADGPMYNVPERLVVEKDWSSAAFPLCMGAFSSEGITVTGLNTDSVQGDKEILNVLKRFGAEVSIEPDDIFSGSDRGCKEEKNSILQNSSDETGFNRLYSVTVKKEGSKNEKKTDGSDVQNIGNNGAACGLSGRVIDASAIPDLVPVISVVAAGTEGETRIVNAGRLRIKESDRLNTTATMLKALGADIEETEDGLIIRGKRNLTGGSTEAFNDHRIAMSAAVAAGICSGDVEILGTECTDKSFPGFWNFLNSLKLEK